jgi:hypothetical protein
MTFRTLTGETASATMAARLIATHGGHKAQNLANHEAGKASGDSFLF